MSEAVRRLRSPFAPLSRGALAVAVVALGLAAVACRQDMQDQPKLKAQRGSAFFADGSGSRPLPAHTVARGTLHTDLLLYTGKTDDGGLAMTSPLPVTRDLLVRGQDRFNIFCSPCHGRLADGRGMIVRRGFKQPPSMHEERLRIAPPGYFFDVMSNGFGQMPSYGAAVPVEDRWAIAAYIRALQLSQHADAAKLTAEERAKLDQPVAEPSAAGEEH